MPKHDASYVYIYIYKYMYTRFRKDELFSSLNLMLELLPIYIIKKLLNVQWILSTAVCRSGTVRFALIIDFSQENI